MGTIMSTEMIRQKASASVVVVNTAPEIASVSMTPTTVYTNDTVSAVATATDADGDDLTLTYAFSVDGTIVQDGPDDTLDGHLRACSSGCSLRGTLPFTICPSLAIFAFLTDCMLEHWSSSPLL